MSNEHPSAETSDDTAARSGLGVGIPVAIVLGGLVLVAAGYFANSDSEITRDTADLSSYSGSGDKAAIAGAVTDQAPAVDLSLIDVSSDAPRLGSASSPVTIIAYTDLECSFCRQFHQETFPLLTQHYIDTGRVQFVFKDFPLQQIHPLAHSAAQAARCADAEGGFWPYVDMVFAHQSALASKDLVAYAKLAGLDETAFTRCMTEQTYQSSIDQSAQEAIALGITATPAFVINGKLYEGALPFTELQAILDSILVKNIGTEPS